MAKRTIPLGSFDLHAPIGAGGSGEVWLANHRVHGVRVAVKVLTSEAARKPFFRASFRNEVRAAAGLDHPNIVTVFDYGEVDERSARMSNGRIIQGSPWLALEFVDSGSLDFHRGRMQWSDLRRVLIHILEALSHAHARGLTHRDIKPGNVMLGRAGAVAKLTDFGLAHASDPNLRDSHTPGLSTAGTPAYMAPEQFRESWRDFGPWTDLYALGATTWTMICGDPPFGKKINIETLTGHLYAQLPRLRPAVPVPVELEGWLRILLEKNVADRYSLAADALHHLLQLPDQAQGEVIRPSTAPGDENTREVLPFEVPPERDWKRPERKSTTLTRAPTPDSWRSLRESARKTLRLSGVGLGLFGLRTIPLVGREGEREALWSALRSVERSGRAQMLMLAGQTGIGKSRLAGWLSERSHEVGTARSITATHSPYSGPSDGLRAMLARHLHCVGLSPAEVRTRLETLMFNQGVTDPDEWDAMTALITHSAGPDDGVGQRIVRLQGPAEEHALVLRHLRRMSADRPVVMVLENLQHDLDTLQFCEWLLELQETAPLPLLLVATFNEDNLEPTAPQHAMLRSLRRRPDVSRLELTPLAPANMKELLQVLLGIEGELADEVEERAEGNPLLAVQLVGDQVDRGLLEPGLSGFRLRSGAPLSMPGDLQALWWERLSDILDGCEEEVQASLELAAILGTNVDGQEWRKACAEFDLEPSSALVDTLLSRSLARSSPEGPQVAWTFVHPMVAESLRRRAWAQDRSQAMHRACANILTPAVSVAALERLAHHLIGAGSPGEALHVYLTAARIAEDRGDIHRMGALLEARQQALEASEVPPLDDASLYQKLLAARLQWMRGHLRAANRTLDELDAAIHPDRSSPRLRAETLLAQARAARENLDSEHARELMQKARGLAIRVGDLPLASRCLLQEGMLLVRQGDSQQATTLLEEARGHMTRVGDDYGVAMCETGLGDAARQLGDLDEAKQHFDSAQHSFDRAGSREGLAISANHLAEIARLCGDLTSAEEGYRDSLQRFERLGQQSRTVITQLNLALVLIEQARFEEARPLLDRIMLALRKQALAVVELFARGALLACDAATPDEEHWTSLLGRIRAGVMQGAIADVDLARCAVVAARRASAAGFRDRAREAYALALDQYKSLGRTSEARSVAREVDELDMAWVRISRD